MDSLLKWTHCSFHSLLIETGYVEVEADCEEEAKALAGEAALEGRVLFHDAEVESADVESLLEGENEYDLK